MCGRSRSSEMTPHLHFLHHLLAEGADLSGRGDDHVLGALILTGDAIEEVAIVLQVDAEVRLEERKRTDC